MGGGVILGVGSGRDVQGSSGRVALLRLGAERRTVLVRVLRGWRALRRVPRTADVRMREDAILGEAMMTVVDVDDVGGYCVDWM